MVSNRGFDCVLATESQAPCQLTPCLGFTSVFAATFVLCSNAGRYYCSSSTGNWVRLRSANPAFVRSRTRMSQIAKRQDLGRVKKRCRGHRSSAQLRHASMAPSVNAVQQRDESHCRISTSAKSLRRWDRIAKEVRRLACPASEANPLGYARHQRRSISSGLRLMLR